jgi:hypothetical protein
VRQQAFSQLVCALALRHFGRDLKTNPLWQSLSPEEQKAWRSLLNPERFYDPKTNRVINLAENYLGVAARIASIGYELGISNDRAFLDKLLDRAAGAVYGRKSLRRRRAADRTFRSLLERVRALHLGSGGDSRAQRPARQSAAVVDGPRCVCGGTSFRRMVTVTTGGAVQGVVSYLDTPEIAGFLASHPEFRPAPLADIAALYYQAWNYLLHDYRSDAHLLSIFAFGRGNYAYISREREWQQTTGLFRQACKLAYADRERTRERRHCDVSCCAGVVAGCAF